MTGVGQDGRLSRCPICGEVSKQQASTRRPVSFGGLIRRFPRCTSCGSRSLDPMPSELELGDLYGVDYNAGDGESPPVEGDPRAYDWVLETLRTNRPKRFVDYGCGGGTLLARVAATGVEAVGFDLDSDGLEAASRASGCRVHSIADIGMHVGSADVVHLGDVLEHVPNPAEVLGRACSLLRPGGLLLSEGPLEANLSVFNGVIAIVALARWWKPVDTPPHHVHLATARGQRKLFQRVGLTQSEFETSDIAWPAPGRWTREVAGSPRLSALFFVRKFSTVVWNIVPGRSSERMSNRFRYSGTTPI